MTEVSEVGGAHHPAIAVRFLRNLSSTFDSMRSVQPKAARSVTRPSPNDSTSRRRANWCTSQHSRTPVLREPAHTLLQPADPGMRRKDFHDEVRGAVQPIQGHKVPSRRHEHEIGLENQRPRDVQDDVERGQEYLAQVVLLDVGVECLVQARDKPLVHHRR